MERSSSSLTGPLAGPGVGRRSWATSSIWVLSVALVVFVIENIWVDQWLRRKSRHIPTMVPEAQSGIWFVALLVMAILCILLVVAQILVTLDRGISVRKRMGTGFATLSAVALCVLWVLVTSGVSSGPSLGQENKSHSVTLNWKASRTEVKGYNVYRSTARGGPYVKINPELVRGLTYTDESVKSKTTYYYTVRAMNAKGIESVDSNDTKAIIP